MDAKILFLVVIIVIGYLYLTQRTSVKEGFGKPIDTGELRKPCKPSMVLNQGMQAPYLKAQLMDVDDYEYNLVFQQEGDREISKALYNKLQSQYPLDWSTQPPSSAHFQAGLQKLKESFQAPPVTPSGSNPYREINAEAFTPPDTSTEHMEERKILQMYRPAKTDSLESYQLEDANDLINRIYDAKGLIPEVKRDGNVYEIIGTRRKDEKIVYEDENPPAQRAPVEAAGEGTITVPATAVDVAAGLDPFFTPSASTHMDRWDYTKFTPGLERMFAPTYPTVEWY
jgi:hypothetical protein